MVEGESDEEEEEEEVKVVCVTPARTDVSVEEREASERFDRRESGVSGRGECTLSPSPFSSAFFSRAISASPPSPRVGRGGVCVELERSDSLSVSDRVTL